MQPLAYDAVKETDIGLSDQLADRSETDLLTRKFNVDGRVQIPNFLKKDAALSILHYLLEQSDWNRVFNIDGKHYDTDANAVDSWPLRKRSDLLSLIHKKAESEFQYCYDALPIYDIYHKSPMRLQLIHAIHEFLNNEVFLNLMRVVADDQRISFADAQATRFQPGHFLTSHNDDVSGKNRCVAYVLNLSQDWNANWGGALLFFGKNGNIDCGYTPSFNTLNLIRVPATHSVGIVAPFATSSRLSITGWLRSGNDPLAT